VCSDGGERLYAYGPEGFTAQQAVGGEVEYALLDGLGSVRHLTDAGRVWHVIYFGRGSLPEQSRAAGPASLMIVFCDPACVL
jgi:hypothetical protein